MNVYMYNALYDMVTFVCTILTHNAHVHVHCIYMSLVHVHVHMQVNDQSISDANHDDAAKAFKLAGSAVQLLVQYDPVQFNRFQVQYYDILCMCMYKFPHALYIQYMYRYWCIQMYVQCTVYAFVLPSCTVIACDKEATLSQSACTFTIGAARTCTYTCTCTYM